MQRSSTASRMRALAGSPLTPVLSALAAAGVGCGRQQPAAPAPEDSGNPPAQAPPDAAPDALAELFRDASPEVIAAQLESMLDGGTADASSRDASVPPPKPTVRPQSPPPKPTATDPTPRPIYRGVDV